MTDLTTPFGTNFPDREGALVNGLLRPLAAFRIVALAWAIIGVVLSRDNLVQPLAAVIVLGAMTVITLLVTPLPGRGSILPATLLGTMLLELSIGVTALIADGFVFDDLRPQSLPWSWPAAGIMLAGIAYGARAGFVSALLIGIASLTTETLLLGRDSFLDGQESAIVTSISKLGLWLVAGTLAGYVVQRLRRAEQEISEARAREGFARELHDGVLQTLAVIQRRSTDTELSALARDQEHDLRSFIAGRPDSTDARPLEPSIRSIAAKHERMYPACKVHVVIANDLPDLTQSQVDALSGAVGEALTNASKHGDASKVTVYAEPTEDSFIEIPDAAKGASVFVSVKDDGAGFDTEAATERIGLSRSIRGRLTDAGGYADIKSTVGRGAEVTLWL